MEIELERPLPQPLRYDLARADRFYSRLRCQVANWLHERHIDGPIREYLLLLPDLFALLIRLLRDPRIEGSMRAQLALVSAYVISPFDLIPDFVVPMGLADDVVALAFILNRVVAIMGQAGEDVLREHWEGSGDVLVHVQRVLQQASLVLNAKILTRLRKAFGPVARMHRH